MSTTRNYQNWEQSIECLYDMEEFLNKKWPKPKMLLKPWLAEGSSNLIYAQAGVGKTYLALSLVLAVITRSPIDPWEPAELTGCLYIDGEMLLSNMQERLKSLTALLPKPQAPFRLLSNHALRLKLNLTINIADRGFQEFLCSYLKAHPEIRLLVLDNLSCLTPGVDQNEQTGWHEISPWIDQLKHLGCAVVLLHHANKKGDQRGTSARADAMDTIIELKPAPGKKPGDGVNFTASFIKNRNFTGTMARSFTFSLETDPKTGEAKWITDAVANRSKIIAQLAGGISQSLIARQIGCDKSYVSRVKKKALEEELLINTAGGLALTPAGLALVGPLSGAFSPLVEGIPLN